MKNLSELQIERLKYKPELPAILRSSPSTIVPETGKKTESVSDKETLKSIFPNVYGKPAITFKKGKNKIDLKKPVKVGVVLSGGQAPGGHNVIAGLFDGLKKANPKNRLFGFLGGPSGILDGKMIEITKPLVDRYRNTGGFDMIKSGRTKIETEEQFARSKKTLTENGFSALVIVGGDDSNTNAALLADYFMAQKEKICVIGVPKTIDGDLKNEQIETSFGFDTATKIYSELVGNICRDVNSAQKYWHFVRLMGRSASHITLEVGLKTQPNIVLIGEEVKEKNMKLSEVIDSITDVIVKRSEMKKNFGICLVPEGLIEFIPEVKQLISALNDIMGQCEEELNKITSVVDKKNFVYGRLPENLAALMKSLPDTIESQLLIDRDPHGNVQVSQIETERLLINMVDRRLKELKKEGRYNGKFSPISHFFGYEGRCGAPSNFDTNYCYALGFNAAMLVINNLTGYISSVRKLVKKPSQWECGGIPLTMMMTMEKRKGKEKPVIQKALVDLKGNPYKMLLKCRQKWALNEDYLFPGPIQYFGPSYIVDMTTKTLFLESKKSKKF